MEALFINSSDIHKFIQSLCKSDDVYSVRGTLGAYHVQKLSQDFSGEMVFNEVRTVEPLKSFFFPPKKRVSLFLARGAASSSESERKKVIIGPKSCDLKSLKILDFVFMEGDFQDPFYIANRENSVIISGDCPSFIETCFCLSMGLNPHPEDGYDLNLSRISSGFIADVGSSKGKALVDEKSSYFQTASEGQLDERQANRTDMVGRLKRKLEQDNLLFESPLQDAVRRNFDSPVWENRAEKCIECGACNLVCSTCHCFLLADQKRGEGFERIKIWDSCQYKSFARVAGGANPRKRLAERIRNRFDKKFVFFPENLGIYACCGCGRCTEACTAKIDIREVLKEVAYA